MADCAKFAPRPIRISRKIHVPKNTVRQVSQYPTFDRKMEGRKMGMSWTNNRWHLDGKPIHAGDGMQMRCPDGTWINVRIESANLGKSLFAHFDYHDIGLSLRVDPDGQNPRELCWEGQAEERRKKDLPAAILELGWHRFKFVHLRTAEKFYQVGDVCVFGHPDEGSYEWAIVRRDEIICSNAGYVSGVAALRDGVAVDDDKEPVRQSNATTYERRDGRWIQKQAAEAPAQ
jgi:hypothetical protein